MKGPGQVTLAELLMELSRAGIKVGRALCTGATEAEALVTALERADEED